MYLENTLWEKGVHFPVLRRSQSAIKAPWSIGNRREGKAARRIYEDGQEYVYFDEEGLVVEKGTAPIEGIPLVEGINVKTMDQPLWALKSRTIPGIFERNSGRYTGDQKA